MRLGQVWSNEETGTLPRVETTNSPEESVPTEEEMAGEAVEAVFTELELNESAQDPDGGLLGVALAGGLLLLRAPENATSHKKTFVRCRKTD